jgi:diguanylate cyclase (GGDEF)-like protein
MVQLAPAAKLEDARRDTTYEEDLEPQDGVEAQIEFWRRHVRIGVLLYALGALGVLGYALATPSGRNRTPLIAIDVASLVMSLTVFRAAGLRLVATKWRETFFFSWSAATLVFISTAGALDGGTHSTLSYLLVLPLLFGALAYTPRYVTGLALLAVACSAGVGTATPDPQVSATLIFVLATGIAGVLTVAGANNRTKLNQQLVELAAMDSMTGCLAHRAFNRRLAEEVDRARRYGRPFGLVMVDLDNLKSLNDTAGHRAGDDALRGVASGLKAAARASDVVGRLGGDEFAVLLPETEPDDLPAVLDRLRAVTHGAASGTRDSLLVTLSLGSTVWAGPDDDARQMLSRADDALYAAKSAGRGRSVAWEPSIVHLDATGPVLRATTSAIRETHTS